MPLFIERPDGLPPVNGFSHVATATGTMIFISGQVPLGPDGTLAGEDVSAQAEQVFRNLQVALHAARVSWADVVKLTYYLTDIADLAAVRSVRDRYLHTNRLPASSLVQVAALVNPAFRLEIDAIAVREDQGRQSV
jgi:reactive intermediate/imine deaminase